MWSGCHPRSDEDLKACEELGRSLSRLSQPTILTLLAQSSEPLHGYVIAQQAAQTPMFGGKKPDATGIYRALKRLEESGYVTSAWDTPEEGSAKRLFTLTDHGRDCLRRWVDALACYALTIEELREAACSALGIDVPEAPQCSHGADVDKGAPNADSNANANATNADANANANANANAPATPSPTAN